MNVRRRNFARAALTFLLLTPTLLATRAHAQVTVSLHPDTLFVAPGQPDRGLLTIRNEGLLPLEIFAHEWLLDPGLAVTLGAPLPSTLAPGETALRPVSIDGTVRLRGDPVLLALSFRSGTSTGAAVARIPVAAWSAPDPSTVVDVEVVGSLASLHDGDESSIYILARNNTTHPVQVDSIVTIGPQFIEFEKSSAAGIPPGASTLYTIDLVAREWVQRGPHTVFFVIHLTWEGAAGPTQGNLIVSRDIDVGVRGESEILTLFSLPSFLLLPGFLMLVAFGMGWQWSGRHPGLSVNPKDLRFWVIAVGLSLLWVYLYPLLPGGRNYLRGYGMVDVAWVWLWSILLGASSAWGMHRFLQSRAARIERDIAARTPHPDDDEVATLRKLARRGEAVELPRMDFPVGARTMRGLVLQEVDGSSWVAPSILYRWQPKATEQDRNALQSSLESRDAGEIAALLERLVKSGSVDVHWQRQDGFDSPRLVAGTDSGRGNGYLVVEDVG